MVNKYCATCDGTRVVARDNGHTSEVYPCPECYGKESEMTDPTPPPAAETLTDLKDDMLIAVIEQAAQMAVTGGMTDQSRQFWSRCRAELLLRLSARPEPGMDTGELRAELLHGTLNLPDCVCGGVLNLLGPNLARCAHCRSSWHLKVTLVTGPGA